MNISWRDRQLNGFKLSAPDTILEQEKVMLDYIEKSGISQWKWDGDQNSFKEIFQKNYVIANDAPGIIIFGQKFFGLSTGEICTYIQNAIQNKQAAYVAINRYFISCHNLPFVLNDNLSTALDQVMTYCNPQFKRLHTFDHVDGAHMVAAHPMDCYGLCR